MDFLFFLLGFCIGGLAATFLPGEDDETKHFSLTPSKATKNYAKFVPDEERPTIIFPSEKTFGLLKRRFEKNDGDGKDTNLDELLKDDED